MQSKIVHLTEPALLVEIDTEGTGRANTQEGKRRIVPKRSEGAALKENKLSKTDYIFHF